MRLISLDLETYRNHKNFSMKFGEDSGTTYIIGPNAQGKTNILEAIYLLALTKSFRTSKQTDLINWGSEYSRVKGIFESKGEQFTLEAFYGKPPHPARSFKKNGVKTSTVNFIGNSRIVFFHPEDLNMLYLGPDLRRRYLDILNVQINPRYYESLRKYKRILEQRNSLLKRIKERISPRKDLNIWNEQLAEQGSTIILERLNTIAFLNAGINEKYKEISSKEEPVSIEYKTITDNISHSLIHNESAEPADTYFVSRTDLRSRNKVKEKFISRLEAGFQRDLQREYTCTGPHRDDFTIKLRNKPLNEHASRGEYRSILLCLKMLEIDYYKQFSGESPILLLDDVFSELDPTRQESLLDSINDCQVILTTTHMDEYLKTRRHKGIKLNSDRILCMNIKPEGCRNDAMMV